MDAYSGLLGPIVSVTALRDMNAITVTPAEIERLVDKARESSADQHGGEPWLFVLGRDFRGRLLKSHTLLLRLRAYEALARQSGAPAALRESLTTLERRRLARYCAAIARARLRLAHDTVVFDPAEFLDLLEPPPAGA